VEGDDDDGDSKDSRVWAQVENVLNFLDSRDEAPVMLQAGGGQLFVQTAQGMLGLVGGAARRAHEQLPGRRRGESTFARLRPLHFRRQCRPRWSG